MFLDVSVILNCLIQIFGDFPAIFLSTTSFISLLLFIASFTFVKVCFMEHNMTYFSHYFI